MRGRVRLRMDRRLEKLRRRHLSNGEVTPEEPPPWARLLVWLRNLWLGLRAAWARVRAWLKGGAA
jgi:hypothetical protein